MELHYYVFTSQKVYIILFLKMCILLPLNIIWLVAALSSIPATYLNSQNISRRLWAFGKTSKLVGAYYQLCTCTHPMLLRIHASIFLYIVRNNLATVYNPTICCLCYYLNLDLDINLCSNLDQYFEFRFLNTDNRTVKFKKRFLM